MIVAPIPVDSLIPYVRNPRTHSDAQVAQIAASIREFGWTNPILIDEKNSIIAGHGRLLAARKLGFSEVPAITLSHLTDAQKRALVIADNKLALNAGWDEELLGLELGELRDGGFDLGLTGWSEQELDQLFAPEIDRLNEWEGMPEFDADNSKAHRSIMIYFRDEKGVNDFAALIGQPITDTTKSAWFPQMEIDRLSKYRIIADEPAISDLHSI